MTSEGLGEMFEGDSADTLAGKFPLVSMWGRAEGLMCADPGARTPISVSGNWSERSVCDQRSKLRLATIFGKLFSSSYYCHHCSKLQKGLSYFSEILHGLLTNKNIRIQYQYNLVQHYCWYSFFLELQIILVQTIVQYKEKWLDHVT